MIEYPSPDVRQWTLPNGLVLLVEEDRSSPVVSVQAWCETGSITEGEWLGAGLSHILEHMLFKGTNTRGPNEIAQAIQNVGGYINAYTSFDRTVYWIDAPSKGASVALDILADAMMNSTLPSEEYAKEQEVIRREFAMGQDDPDRMSSLTLFATAYQQHPYQHPIIGHIDIFNRLTRDDVIRYYKSRYIPNNLFFVVSGDVDAQSVYEQLAAAFENQPRQALPPIYIPPEPPQTGRREEHIEFPTELTRMEIAWHTPELTHPDVPALDVLALILGDGRSSRLYRRVREELALVHGIHAWCYTPGQPGLFGIEALLDPDKRDATVAEVFSMLNDIKANGVTPGELSKALRQAVAGHLSNLSTTRGRASDIGSNWLLTRNVHFTRDYLAALQRVTLADIQRVANAYLTERNLTITSLNPPGSLPAAAAQTAAKNEETIQKFELPNGFRLLVREDPRLPLVSTAVCFKAGILAETAENNGINRLYSRVLLKGTATRSAEEIAEQIESLGGTIGAEAGNNSFAVSMKMMQPDLATGLEILADVLRNPTFPQQTIDREKEAQLAAIKAEEDEPTAVARNLLRRNLYTGHPYGLRASGSPETVATLDREQLLAFHREFVAGRNGVIAVFGAVKTEDVRALVDKYFADLPAGKPALETPPVPTPLTASQSVEEFEEKEQAIVMTGFHGVSLFHPDRYTLELIEEACSDLGSRFFVRIREKLGLAYFVGAGQMMGLVPGPFVFYLGTDPAKVEAVKAEFMDEIRALAANGLTQEELARAKAKLLGQEALRNQSNDAFAHACALDELYGLGFDEYTRLRSRIESVTLENTRDVARKLFGEAHSVLAVVRPK